MRLLLSALVATAAFAGAVVPSQVRAQMPPDAAKRNAAQVEAMKKLANMDGVWRGQAWTITPTGRHEVTQTERIGPLLGGAVKIIEGRGYNPDGATGFNAFAVVSYEPDTGAYTLRSYAMGRAGDFKFTPTVDGYDWEIPAGPATMRYSATIKDGVLHEVGHRIVPGQPPVQFFEMTVKRLGDSAWPAAGAVPAK